MNAPLCVRKAVDEAFSEGIINDKNARSIANDFALAYSRGYARGMGIEFEKPRCSLLASVIYKYIRANIK